jgi:hypothetical protein
MTDEREGADNNKASKKESPTGRDGKRIKVYQHSDLLYWWAVWFYGLICAGITWIQGTKIRLGDGPEIFVHPSAWVGISFICLVIFVLVFTSARARGMKSMVLLLIVALVAGILEQTTGLRLVSGWFALLKVHMNLAFYLFFSLTLLVFWIVAIFGFDRLTYWYFAPSEVGKKVVMSEGSENFVGSQVRITRHSDDLFVHRILGLWFLGFGTGDLDVCIITGGSEKRYELKNVWRIGYVEDRINRLVRSREHT